MIEERPMFKKINYGWSLIFGMTLLAFLAVYNLYFFFTSSNASSLYAALYIFFAVIAVLYFYTFYALKYTVQDNNLILKGFMVSQVIPIRDVVSLKQSPTKPSEFRKLTHKYPTRKFSTFANNRWILTWLNDGKTNQVVWNPSPDIIRAVKRKKVRSARGVGGGKK